MPYQAFNDSTGRAFTIFGQEMGNSCLVAAAITVVKLFNSANNLGANEASVRRAIFSHGTRLGPSMKVRLNDKTATDNYESYEIWGEVGQFIDPIVPFLNENGVQAKLVAGGSVGLCNSASMMHPLVIRTSWKATWGGGGHFVTCLGPLGANILFLDSIYGLQERPSAELPRYKPTNAGGAKAASGVFDDEGVTCVRGMTWKR